jgi:hypothetical protein
VGFQSNLKYGFFSVAVDPLLRRRPASVAGLLPSNGLRPTGCPRTHANIPQTPTPPQLRRRLPFAVDEGSLAASAAPSPSAVRRRVRKSRRRGQKKLAAASPLRLELPCCSRAPRGCSPAARARLAATPLLLARSSPLLPCFSRAPLRYSSLQNISSLVPTNCSEAAEIL